MQRPLTHAPTTVSLRRRGRDRTFTWLHPTDARRLAWLAAQCAPAIEAVGVGRRHSPHGTAVGPEALPVARHRYHRSLLAIARSELALVTDVRECYPSCRPAEVARALREAGCSLELVAEVRAFLEALQDEGVPGLPVGPQGADTFAEAILVQVDAHLPRTLPSTRWVDDMVFAARDARDIVSLSARIEEALGQRGLAPATSKTRVIPAAHAPRIAAPSAFGDRSPGSDVLMGDDPAPSWTYNRRT